MSTTNDLERLEIDCAANEELRTKLDEAARRIADTRPDASDGELMVAAAAEFGYEISVADLERVAADSQEISDDELEAVAGGAILGHDDRGHDNWCLTAWHCFAATLHTDCDSKDACCWSDFVCWFNSNQPGGGK